jgi:2-polyprenyl-3-methyl-5-hydroxy-6-metoxy-1,4-benzoquinol methylase
VLGRSSICESGCYTRHANAALIEPYGTMTVQPRAVREACGSQRLRSEGSLCEMALSPSHPSHCARSILTQRVEARMEVPVKSSRTLEEQRLHSAEASGGKSTDVIYDRIVEVVEEHDLRGRVLDYGAGIGNLTRRLFALGRFEQIAGADILPRPEDLPSDIPWHCLDLNRRDVVPAASFDAVIAAEVIEHLENPREVAREWYRILKPGGTLLLSTPNNESIRSLVALLFRGHYVACSARTWCGSWAKPGFPMCIFSSPTPVVYRS